GRRQERLQSLCGRFPSDVPNDRPVRGIAGSTLTLRARGRTRVSLTAHQSRVTDRFRMTADSIEPLETRESNSNRPTTYRISRTSFDRLGPRYRVPKVGIEPTLPVKGTGF